LLGYPDQALKRVQEAVILAQELSQPFSLCFALVYSLTIHCLRGEGKTAQERAEILIPLSTEQGFAHFLANGLLLRGWALVRQGQGREGITQLCQGLAAYRATRADLNRSFFLAGLAEAYAQTGQTEEGLSVAAEVLAAVESTGERFYEAEMYRLKGTLTLQSKDPSPKSQVEVEAEACFHKAIEIARRQQAKSLELREVISLSRLWQRQGKKDEARQPLAEIYGWFTEGFDTADLQEAKAVLEELRR